MVMDDHDLFLDVIIFSVQVFVFMSYLGFIIFRYQKLINGSVQIFLLTYFILIILRAIMSILLFILKDEENNRDYMQTLMIGKCVDLTIVQLGDILFYFVLFKMKRIEIQFNPRFATAEDVINSLLRFVYLFRVTFLFIIAGFIFKTALMFGYFILEGKYRGNMDESTFFEETRTL